MPPPSTPSMEAVIVGLMSPSPVDKKQKQIRRRSSPAVQTLASSRSQVQIPDWSVGFSFLFSFVSGRLVQCRVLRIIKPVLSHKTAVLCTCAAGLYMLKILRRQNDTALATFCRNSAKIRNLPPPGSASLSELAFICRKRPKLVPRKCHSDGTIETETAQK